MAFLQGGLQVPESMDLCKRFQLFAGSPPAQGELDQGDPQRVEVCCKESLPLSVRQSGKTQFQVGFGNTRASFGNAQGQFPDDASGVQLPAVWQA